VVEYKLREEEIRKLAEIEEKKLRERERALFPGMLSSIAKDLLNTARGEGKTSTVVYLEIPVLPPGSKEDDFFWRFAKWLEAEHKIAAFVQGRDLNEVTGGDAMRMEFGW
jgi:hypothetical protein